MAGPACPGCRRLVPLTRTQWRLGTPFACKGCGERLVVPRSNALLPGFGLLAVFWLSRRDFPDAWGGEIGLFVVMLAVGLPITWWMTRVETAD